MPFTRVWILRNMAKAKAKTAVKPSSKATTNRKPTAKAALPRAAARPKTVPRTRRAKPASAVALAEAERGPAFDYALPSGGPRRFSEERFLFPKTYEVNRVRVLVRDTEWLFAYWDLNPRAFEAIRQELGERTMALSRLTLRVLDAEGATSEVVILPSGARSWYVRIDPSRRGYLAELGITLPSGQFRSLARSNTVRAPRGGPSPQAAVRSVNHELAFREGNVSTGVDDEAGTLTASETDAGGGLLERPLPGGDARPSRSERRLPALAPPVTGVRSSTPTCRTSAILSSRTSWRRTGSTRR
jgi:hypothetical protein